MQICSAEVHDLEFSCRGVGLGSFAEVHNSRASLLDRGVGLGLLLRSFPQDVMRRLAFGICIACSAHL